MLLVDFYWGFFYWLHQFSTLYNLVFFVVAVFYSPKNCYSNFQNIFNKKVLLTVKEQIVREKRCFIDSSILCYLSYGFNACKLNVVWRVEDFVLFLKRYMECIPYSTLILHSHYHHQSLARFERYFQNFIYIYGERVQDFRFLRRISLKKWMGDFWRNNFLDYFPS